MCPCGAAVILRGSVVSAVFVACDCNTVSMEGVVLLLCLWLLIGMAAWLHCGAGGSVWLVVVCCVIGTMVVVAALCVLCAFTVRCYYWCLCSSVVGVALGFVVGLMLSVFFEVAGILLLWAWYGGARGGVVTGVVVGASGIVVVVVAIHVALVTVDNIVVPNMRRLSDLLLCASGSMCGDGW